jgi:hypothetical protein
VLLVQSGFPLDYVMDLDLPSFDSLVQSMNRLTASDKTEQAWTSMIAAQASGKEMKKWAKRWEAAASSTAQPDNDAAALRRRVGGGI